MTVAQAPRAAETTKAGEWLPSLIGPVSRAE
jgi:hypothetical protein